MWPLGNLSRLLGVVFWQMVCHNTGMQALISFPKALGLMLAVFSHAASAQDLQPGEAVVDPDVFDAFSVGTTVTYDRWGEFYGAEQHFENRKVKWLRRDGTCSPGSWVAKGQMICFTYEDQPGQEHCLHVVDTDRGRAHRFLGAPPEDDLYVTGQTTTPLRCTGPEVGVSFQPDQAAHD